MGDCLTRWVTWLVTGAWGDVEGKGDRVSRSTAFQRNKQARSSRFIPMTSTLIGLFWDLTVPYVRYGKVLIVVE